MRTTIELPDELFRQLKARAALDQVSLKDLITRWVERGLRDDDGIVTKPGARRPVPVEIPPKNRIIQPLTGRQVDEILAAEDAGLEE